MQPDFDLLEKELVYKASRSGGAGGQNVNKVSTKIELNFDLVNSVALSEEQKLMISEKLAARITNDGILQIIAQTERTQLKNKKVALTRFRELIASCFVVQKVRKPSQIKKVVKEKRKEAKQRQSALKSNRRKDFGQEI